MTNDWYVYGRAHERQNTYRMEAERERKVRFTLSSPTHSPIYRRLIRWFGKTLENLSDQSNMRPRSV